MTLPRIGMTPWRRPLPTFLAERTDLYTLATEYVSAVIEAGGLPLILPHLSPEHADEVLDGVDGLVFTGGDDVDPTSYGAVDDGRATGTSTSADAWEIALARRAVARKLPILGICRGIQILNVAFGGTLDQHISQADTPHPPTPSEPEAVMAQRHEITLRPDCRLAAVYGTEARVVNTIHHQGLGRVADALEPVAWAPDGVVEAVEATDPTVDLVAVQWHPEKIIEDGERALFTDFVERVRAVRDERQGRVAVGP
jgi:putative glutamine amidotransferase